MSPLYRLARIKKAYDVCCFGGCLSIVFCFVLGNKNAAAVTVINREETSRGYCIIYVCVCTLLLLLVSGEWWAFSVRSETRGKHTDIFLSCGDVEQQSSAGSFRWPRFFSLRAEGASRMWSSSAYPRRTRLAVPALLRPSRIRKGEEARPLIK